jgi:hypothetical protein
MPHHDQVRSHTKTQWLTTLNYPPHVIEEIIVLGTTESMFTPNFVVGSLAQGGIGV